MQSLSSTSTQSWLSWFLRGFLILLFLILFSKLFELQIIKGAYYRGLSEENRIQRISIPAERGKILARGGEKIEGEAFAHITGYLGEANEDEVGKIDPRCPEKGPIKLKQLVGRGGINEEYNCVLTGVDGEELVEVDSLGKKIRTLGVRNPVLGMDVKTTVDFMFQKKAYEEVEGKLGAVVMTDAKGEVLALISLPSFDPASPEIFLDDKSLPFFNRAIGGSFHPGSVFKPLVALSALEEGVIDKGYRFTDEGVLEVKTKYGDYSYSNWFFTQYGGKEGEIGIARALARSTDTFFYKVGELLGPEKIASWAKKFGLGEETGIDLPGEAKGLIPDPEWKKKTKNEIWFLGNTYHYAIGQGDLAVTPLSLNRAISVIASNGMLCRPHLSQSIDADCKSLGLSKKNIGLIREGMIEACTEGGTGYTFFDWNSDEKREKVACKTGTAQVGTEEDTHAWFTLINGDIILTVIVEKGGEGSKVAGPIARGIMDYVYLRQNP